MKFIGLGLQDDGGWSTLLMQLILQGECVDPDNVLTSEGLGYKRSLGSYHETLSHLPLNMQSSDILYPEAQDIPACISAA